jgi:hypothetical protein
MTSEAYKMGYKKGQNSASRNSAHYKPGIAGAENFVFLCEGVVTSGGNEDDIIKLLRMEKKDKNVFISYRLGIFNGIKSVMTKMKVKMPKAFEAGFRRTLNNNRLR